MNTSSSEGGIGRTLVTGTPARRSASVRDCTPSSFPSPNGAAGRARDRRTAARPRRQGWPRALSTGGRVPAASTSINVPGSDACSVEARRAPSPVLRAAAQPARNAPPRRDTGWPSRSSARSPGTRTAASRIHDATPDRHRSSARRAGGRRAGGSSVQASASFCFMPPDSRSARRVRNGVSCVRASRRSRSAP